MRSLNAQQDTHIDRMYGKHLQKPDGRGACPKHYREQGRCGDAGMETVDGLPALFERDVRVWFKGLLRSCGLERPI